MTLAVGGMLKNPTTTTNILVGNPEDCTLIRRCLTRHDISECVKVILSTEAANTLNTKWNKQECLALHVGRRSM